MQALATGDIFGAVYSPVAVRIIEAALEAFGRYGVAKTTVDDIVKLAGVSRATFYRHFDGRDALALATIRHEARRVLTEMHEKLDACGSLEEVLVVAFHDAALVYRGHDVLQILVRYEPELLLPAFVGPESPVQRVATEFLTPFVARHAGDHPLAASDPRRCAEWLFRVLLSYLLSPSEYVDLADATSIRDFVRKFLGTAKQGEHA